MFYTYILKSRDYKRHYIGSTSDLAIRLKEHNKGRVKSTKAYIPWEVIYKVSCSTKQEAYIEERRIKRMKNGVQFKEFLSKGSPSTIDDLRTLNGEVAEWPKAPHC